ncbi:MAG: flagellar export chaperone FliS [Nitriliruptoraceae bacterium]|nr:flagellar export chaperone FliS [Nitriliruptoraceae bacterium]
MSPTNAYTEQAAATASPAQLVMMLYDGALARLEAARYGFEADPVDLSLVSISLGKVQAIIGELSATLDHEAGGTVAQGLGSLYSYCLQQLVDANIRKDPAPLDEVTAIVSDLRDAWAQACLPAAATA